MTHWVDVSRETSTLFCVLVSPFHVKHFLKFFLILQIFY